MVQKSFSGPTICIRAPKVVIAKKNAINTVSVITNAKVSKKTKFAKYKKKPHMNVVMLPLKILTPISLNDCCIFSSLVG